MSNLKASLARKAVKTTARHTAHGTASKLKRNPMRTSTLLALGCSVGVVIGWVAGNRPASHLSPQA